MSINRVNISGNLTRDPELKATTGGTSVLTFGVAVNDRRRNPQSGEWEDVPNFVDCVVFGARADSLSRFLSKGSKVAIEGKLRYSSWERDGQRRSKLEVIVDEIEFLSPRQQNNQATGGNQYGAVEPAPTYAAPTQNYNQNYSQNYNQGYAAAQPAQPVQQMPQQQPQMSQQQPQRQPMQQQPVQQAQPAPTVRTVENPPSADVYDEDIPF